MSSEKSSPVRSLPTNNLSPRLGLLYSMMVENRKTLMECIGNLDTVALDFTPDPKKIESIGTLLFHIAAVEYSWIEEDINGKNMDFEHWKKAFALREFVNEEQISGEPLSFYLTKLEQVREDVVLWFVSVDDDILDKQVDVDGELHSIDWIIYHIIEHESTHIGQIRLLKRLMRL